MHRSGLTGSQYGLWSEWHEVRHPTPEIDYRWSRSAEAGLADVDSATCCDDQR